MEFALVIPVLCIVVLFGLLYSRGLERTQWASQLSREVASLAFRLCSSSRDDVLEACLRSDVLEPISNTTERLIPEAGFIVAVFSYDEAGQEARLEAIQTANGVPRDLERFTGSGINKSVLDWEMRTKKTGSPGMALREHGVLVIAAVYLPIGEFASDLAAAIGLSLPTRIGATTII